MFFVLILFFVPVLLTHIPVAFSLEFLILMNFLNTFYISTMVCPSGISSAHTCSPALYFIQVFYLKREIMNPCTLLWA